MRLRTFFLVMAIGAIVNSTVIRMLDLSGDTALAVSMLGMIVLMLACFAFIDPEGELGPGSRKR